MNIVTWNINSLKARKDHVIRFLEENKPDVLMVQELKGLEFPAGDFESLGYKTEFAAQKAYNGVAVFSRYPFTTILSALPGDERDEQARYLEVELDLAAAPPLAPPQAGRKIRLVNIYLPNGNPVFSTAPPLTPPQAGGRDDDFFSEKFTYKLAWMERLKARLRTLLEDDVDFAVGGDFNAIPEARDCHDPKLWINDALYHIETRKEFRAMINLGLTDAFRVFNQESGQYTFWDYQGGAWPANKGIRIDHFLLSPRLADRMEGCTIDTAPRGRDKPSDHTPVVLELAA